MATKTKEDAKTEEQAVPAQPKIRIKLKAYDHKLVDQSAKQIVEAVERDGAKVAGPVPLPTSKKEIHRKPINVCA